MQKTTIIIIALIILLAGSYYYFSGKSYVVRLSESDIQNKLAEKLPLTKTYLFIIQLTLDNPRVHLKDGSNKVVAGLDVVFNIILNKHPRPVGGTVDISAGITYSAEQGQFFLINPVIENLAVQGIAAKYTDKVHKALTKALVEYYQSHPVYTLRITDTKQAVAKMVLKDVLIENKELVITLGI